MSPDFCASSLFFFGWPLISAALLLYIVALIAPNPANVFAWDSLHTTSQNVVELLLYSTGTPSALVSVSGARVAAGLPVVRSVGCPACLSAEVSPARWQTGGHTHQTIRRTVSSSWKHTRSRRLFWVCMLLPLASNWIPVKSFQSSDLTQLLTYYWFNTHRRWNTLQAVISSNQRNMRISCLLSICLCIYAPSHGPYAWLQAASVRSDLPDAHCSVQLHSLPMPSLSHITLDRFCLSAPRLKCILLTPLWP